MIRRGKFITFEGIEGAGKSTQIPLISKWLASNGVDVIVTREPGGTPLSEKIRDLLLHETMSIESELLLMFSARKEHIEQVIKPALAKGTWVLCDRFTEASYAYQGFGRGVELDKISMLENWIQGDLRPDKTFWFNLPVIEGLKRAKKRGNLDRFEAQEISFFESVTKGYQFLADQKPDQIKQLNALLPIDELTELLKSKIEPLL